jgi:pimeloyl-ACP methyl ester carboxylesterase
MGAAVNTTAELVSFDVSPSLPFTVETSTMVGCVHRPAGEPRAILVCWPGGSYARSYWEFANAPGYDFAAHMASRGFTVVAADPLGVGDSSRPANVDAVTLEVMAAGCAEFTRQLRRHLALGDEVPVIGVGHSLGGCITVIAQALYGCYDRVVSLGYTHGVKDAVTSAAGECTEPRAAATEQARAFFEDWEAGYAISPRAPNHAWLYTPSTPPDVVAADDRTVAAWPRQAYVEALLAGNTIRYAAEVGCPVFLGFGDHDIPDHPRDDASFYTGSSDLTIVVLDDAAHCHNFSPNRRSLWDRIGEWAAAGTLPVRQVDPAGPDGQR